MAANPSTDASGTTASTISDLKRREPAILAISVLVLLALGLFISYLLANLDLKQLEWDRAIYLLNAVEAVAFAAAGYIFATQVQRAQVETLTRKADENAAGARAGKALAGTVHEKNLQVQAFGRGTEAAAERTQGLVPDDVSRMKVSESARALRELDDLAGQLFPQAMRAGGAAE